MPGTRTGERPLGALEDPSVRARPYDSRLTEKIAGKVVVTEDVFERALGTTAFALWQILCAHRDPSNGRTTITYKGIQRAKQFQTLSTKQIERGLTRLRKAGLVLDMYRRRVWVKDLPKGRKGKTVEGWAMPRVILGARAVGGLVLIPGHSWKWVRSAPRWGGRREGAEKPKVKDPKQRAFARRICQRVSAAVSRYWEGRREPKSDYALPDYMGIARALGPCPGSRRRYQIGHVRSLTEFNLFKREDFEEALAPENHCWVRAREPRNQTLGLEPTNQALGSSDPGGREASETPIEADPEGGSPGQVGVYGRSASGGTDLYIHRSRHDRSRGVWFSSKTTHHGAALRSVLLSKTIREQGQPGKPPEDQDLPAAPPPPESNASSEERQEPANAEPKKLGGRIGRPPGPRLPPPYPGTRGIPPFPGPDVAPAAYIPAPKKLPDDVKGVEAARWLLKAFRGAVESRYRKRCFVLAGRGKLEKYKNLGKLIEAAELLRDHDIAPAAWAMFSVDAWLKYGIGKGLPRLNWVFSPKRVEDHHEWFGGEEVHYTARRAVHGRAAQELIRRHHRMRIDLASSGAQTEEEVKVVVDRYLPGSLYDDLAQKARERATDDQVRISDAAARGEWVWL